MFFFYRRFYRVIKKKIEIYNIRQIFEWKSINQLVVENTTKNGFHGYDDFNEFDKANDETE